MIGIDISDQTEDRVLLYASQAFRLQAQLDDQDELEVFAFAHQTDLIYRGHPMYERNQFNQSVGAHLLSTHAGLHSPGTKVDNLFQDIASSLNKTKSPVIVTILSDGGVEDQSPKALQSISRSLRLIAKTPNLSNFIVADVDQQWRVQWQSWLKPLAARARVTGTNDADQALDASEWAIGVKK